MEGKYYIGYNIWKLSNNKFTHTGLESSQYENQLLGKNPTKMSLKWFCQACNNNLKLSYSD